MILALSVASAAAGFVAIAQPVSLIQRGDFERRPYDLSLTAACVFDDQVAHSGRRSLRVHVPPEAGKGAPTSGSWTIEGFAPGGTYTISVWVKAENIVPNEGVPGYGYVAVYQYDRFGDYVAFYDFTQPVGSHDWERCTYTFTVDRDTTRLEVPFGLFQASGTLWVDDFTLVEGEHAADIGEIAQPTAHRPSGKPCIAILKDDLPIGGVGSDPEYLKEILDGIEGRPYETTVISAVELADRLFLTPERFAVVILPYGETFPAPAAKAFRRYLHAGGNMLTMGGYAFSNPVGATQPAAAPQPPEECSWHYRIPVTRDMGTTLTFEGHLRCRSVSGPGFAYLAVYQHASDGKLVTWKDTIHLTGDRDWTKSKYGFVIADGTAYIDVKIGLYRCTGTASFDDISLKDERGQELIRDPSFEHVMNPDEVRDHTWYRTHAELAHVSTVMPLSGKYCAKVKLAAAEMEPLIMNTARGRPGDSLLVQPDQIGVFDAQFPLKRVAYAKAAPDQYIVPRTFVADAPMQGWSATTVLGYNEARRVPLINCYDRYGRLRGSAASITYRYGGYYARSAWAIFGATNFDFFPRGAPAATQLLPPIVQALVTETFLHNLETNFATYRQGEPVIIKVKASNFGPNAQRLAIRISIQPEGRGDQVRLDPLFGQLEPDETQEFTAEWRPRRFNASFYRVEARLSLGEGRAAQGSRQMPEADPAREWDKLETGFCVWDEQVVKSGPHCILEDNLFRLNGREHFLQGTDSFSFTFYSAHENPLVWKRDFETMRDSGMNLAENLQVSPLGQSPPYQWPESLLRKIDAMVQLSQQYGQVYMPGLLIGANVVVEDEVLEKEAAWIQAFVKRYKDVPGIIWYINGDFQLRLGDNIELANQRGGPIPRTDVERLWNEFLRRKYASDEALKASWGESRITGALGQVPLEDYGSSEWTDMRAVDIAAFKVELMRRWINRHVRAIREIDPHHAITSEYYQSPSPGIDIIQAIGDHTCANIGYFDKPQRDIERFPSVLRFADLRARGKSMSAGEFGCKTHPAWGDGRDYGYHIARTDEQQEELWLAITHYAWALGASKIHNWDWKDNVEVIFPWGMVYAGDWVKKDCLDVYRATGLVFRQFERRYEPPAVYVLTPDAHRLGAPVWSVFEATLSCFHTLQHMGVDVGTLNECALETIPASATLIFYPIPYQIPDEVYNKLIAWVKAGGTLYVSGDVSYNMFRRRALVKRLEELCGVEFVAERYPNIACDPQKGIAVEVGGRTVTANPAISVRPISAQVLAAASDAERTPVLVQNGLGAGRVVFSTWPLELDNGFAEGIPERNAAIYSIALRVADFHELPPAEGGGSRLPLRVPLVGNGAHGDVYVNPTSTQVPIRAEHDGPALTLAPHRSAVAIWGDSGELLALEDGAGAHFMAYSLRREDLRESRAVCILPLTEGPLRLETRADWVRPAASVGEVCGGRWTEYERLNSPVVGRAISIDIDDVRCFSIIVVAEEADLEQCTTRVARSLSHPWRPRQ